MAETQQQTGAATKAAAGLKVHDWRMIAMVTVRESIHPDHIAREFDRLEHDLRRRTAVKRHVPVTRWMAWMKWDTGRYHLLDCGQYDDPAFVVLHAQIGR